MATIQFIVVNTQYDGLNPFAFARCRNQNILCTSGQVHACFFFITEDTGTFEYQVNAHFGVWKVFRVALRRRFDTFTIYDECIVGGFYDLATGRVTWLDI